MNLIAEKPHDQYGSAVFIRNGLSNDKTSVPDKDDIKVISTKTLRDFLLTQYI